MTFTIERKALTRAVMLSTTVPTTAGVTVHGKPQLVSVTKNAQPRRRMWNTLLLARPLPPPPLHLSGKEKGGLEFGEGSPGQLAPGTFSRASKARDQSQKES